MKNKDYLLDDGRIRNCETNIAKMNLLEYIWFDLFHNKILKDSIEDTIEQYQTALTELFFAVFNTLMIIFFPITLFVKGIAVIKRAKKRVKEENELYK
jgi:uncharacterized membrane protein